MLILFHDDFDGAASAAILAGFFKGNGQKEFRFQAVDYDLKPQWRAAKLPMVKAKEHFAIVDFLYHPSALIWFDHHETTFVKPEYKEDYLHYRHQLSMWDVRAPSCASLIYNRLWPLQPSMTRFAELADAADMVDQARYPSPQAYFDAVHPAIAINQGYRLLTAGQKTELVRRFMQGETGLQAAREAFNTEIETVLAGNRGALTAYASLLTAAGDVAILDIVGTKLPFMRYAIYLYHPNARYSISLYEQSEGVSISMGKNPWIDFTPIDLGNIARGFGGGGHPYAAGIFFDRKTGNPYADARKAVNVILAQLQAQPAQTAA